MSDAALKLVTAKTAAEACKGFAPEPASAALLRDDLSPRQFLEVLTAERQFPDAVRLLAFAMPKKEAIWWACRCARAVMKPDRPPEIAGALAATEAWLFDPSDDNRRAAMKAAEAAGMGTPAGCAAVAAFVSEGSLGPADLAPIPPGEFLAARSVAGSILLAAVATEPEKAEVKFREFLRIGIEVANGLDRWAEAPPPTRPIDTPQATVAPVPATRAAPPPMVTTSHRPAPSPPKGFFKE